MWTDYVIPTQTHMSGCVISCCKWPHRRKSWIEDLSALEWVWTSLCLLLQTVIALARLKLSCQGNKADRCWREEQREGDVGAMGITNYKKNIYIKKNIHERTLQKVNSFYIKSIFTKKIINLKNITKKLFYQRCKKF